MLNTCLAVSHMLTLPMLLPVNPAAAPAGSPAAAAAAAAVHVCSLVPLHLQQQGGAPATVAGT
jgi:hypothetical protein